MSLLQELFRDNEYMMRSLGISRVQENEVLNDLDLDLGEVLYNREAYECFEEELKKRKYI